MKSHFILITLIGLLFSCTKTDENPVPPEETGPTLASASTTGSYTVATLQESDGIRNGEAYNGATIYYPTNATPPYASVVVVPGYSTFESSIQEWGAFYASHGIVAMTIGTNSIFEYPEARAAALLDALETLQQENSRVNSPLQGHLDTTKFALSGWSMGGGGAQLAAKTNPSIKALVLLCPWLDSSTLTPETVNHTVPAMFLSSQYDQIAPPSTHTDVHYAYMPETTPKLLYEISFGTHITANYPSGSNGDIGRMGLSWLKVYLENDMDYRPFLFSVPNSASNYETNLVE